MAKETKTEIDEIKESIDNKKIIIGTDSTMKALKMDKLKKIFMSSTCPEDVKNDLNYYASFKSVPITALEYPSDEVGVICKKPFSITVLAIIK